MKNILFTFVFVMLANMAGAMTIIEQFNAKCDSVSTQYNLPYGTEAQNLALAYAITGEVRTLWSILMTTNSEIIVKEIVITADPCPEYKTIVTGGLLLRVDSLDYTITELTIREMERDSEELYKLKGEFLKYKESIGDTTSSITPSTLEKGLDDLVQINLNDVLIGGKIKDAPFDKAIWNHTQNKWVDITLLHDSIRLDLQEICLVKPNSRNTGYTSKLQVSTYVGDTNGLTKKERKVLKKKVLKSAGHSKFIFEMNSKPLPKNDLTVTSAGFKANNAKKGTVNICTNKLTLTGKLAVSLGLMKNPYKK